MSRKADRQSAKNDDNAHSSFGKIRIKSLHRKHFV